MTHTEVRLTDHARIRMGERLGVRDPLAQLELAREIAQVGTYVGMATHDPELHLLKGPTAYGLVAYSPRGVIVTSVWGDNWYPVHDPDLGGFWMHAPDRPNLHEIAAKLSQRFKVSRG